MKKILTPALLLFSLVINAQVVCDLTYERTLAGFDVYIHNPSGATMYRAKMYIDSDGSPRSYGPNNSGLDYTANAGYPGNWWALVTDVNGDPIIQGSSDPYPGMYVSTTSLVDSHYGQSNPLRYVNSETVPFIAMPTNVLADGGIHVGDVAYVYNTTTGQSCFAIYADAGNTTSIGEGSIYLASQIGVDPDVRTGGTSAGIIDYVVFPNSGFGQGKIPSIHEIDSIGNLYLNKPNVGGPCIVSCIGPVFGDTPPSTSVIAPELWDVATFVSNYNDIDTGCASGIERSFYDVYDLNTSGEWHANNTNGFFYDDFVGSAIDPVWSITSGTWTINGSGQLEQSNESLSNTNIHALLTQNLSNAYLYHWKGTISGSGINRRAGMHFSADQPDSSNLGNSYFVYFRMDDDKVQIYKSVNNSWGSSTMLDVAYNFTAGTEYDYKVLFDHTTGLIRIYVNDALVGEWTDPSPFNSGDYISFRAANCNYKVDDFRVYRSRNSSATVSVGSASTNDIRYQNPNPLTPAAKISSVVTDNVGEISPVSTHPFNIDYTVPPTVAGVYDGSAADIDTTYDGTQLLANWAFTTDPNSDIVEYEYAMGTSLGAADVVPWTSNAMSNTVTATGLSLVDHQMYYTSVRAKNGAGLWTSSSISNGQLYLSSMSLKASTIEDVKVNLFPNPNKGILFISIDANKFKIAQIIINDITGKMVYQNNISSASESFDISTLEQGNYFVNIILDGKAVHRMISVVK